MKPRLRGDMAGIAGYMKPCIAMTLALNNSEASSANLIGTSLVA